MLNLQLKFELESYEKNKINFFLKEFTVLITTKM